MKVYDKQEDFKNNLYSIPVCNNLNVKVCNKELGTVSNKNDPVFKFSEIIYNIYQQSTSFKTVCFS